MMFLRKLGVFVFIALFFSTSLHATPSENALAWLAQQQQADGYFAAPSDLATPYQSSAEALLLIRETSEIEPSIIEAAFSYLHSPAQQTTEYLSRRIIADIAFGYPVSDDLIDLLARQNRYGGFGEHAGYHETVIDTSFALSAISAADKNQHQVISLALQNLLSKQQDDGGWRDGSNEDSVYLTALAMQAMTPYSNVYAGVSMALSKAQDYLLGLRQGDGGWGEDYKTAAVVLGLAPNIADMAVLDASYARLQQSQAEDGSWYQDVYTTALAARALNSLESDVVVDDTHASSITGFVVHAANGMPLSDVSIAINELPGVKATTGSDGGFAIPDLSAKSYTLSISKQGYASISRVIDVQANQIFQLGTVSLNTVQEAGLVYGMAIDDETGKALSGVTVKISDSSSQQTLTAEDGRFELHTLLPGEYTVTFSKSGYSTVSGTVAVSGGNITNINVPMTLEGSYQPTEGDVSGTVVNGQTGLPLAGVRIELDSGVYAITDETGRFILTNLVRGSYQATITSDGYNDAELAIVFVPTSSGDLGSIVLYPTVDITVADTVTLIGTVIDADNQSPIVGALVSSLEHSTVTSTEGSFVLNGLTDTTLSIKLSANGYQDATYNIAVSGYGSSQVTLVLNGVKTPESDAIYSLSGVVVDASSNAPLQAAVVTGVFGDQQYATLSGADGSFFLSNLRAIDGTLSVGSENYIEQSFAVELSALTVTELGQIRLREKSIPLPDLVVSELDLTATQTDPKSLTYTGVLGVTVSNYGVIDATDTIQVLAFYDVDQNNRYDDGLDVRLGDDESIGFLGVGASETLSIPVFGGLPYRDAPIKVWVDSSEKIEERSESNNIKLSSSLLCKVEPNHGDVVTDPDDQRTWLDASVGTFAQLFYGSDDYANRKKVTEAQMLVDGIFNPSGMQAAKLISAGRIGSCTGVSTGGGSFGYECVHGVTVAALADEIDEKWFQTSGTVGDTVFDLGFNAAKVAVFNTIDHGPLPGEAIESTVYLSNDKVNWIQAITERIWLEGYLYNEIYDGFVYTVGTGTDETFRYVSIIHGGPGAIISDGDNEINGLIGLNGDLSQTSADLTASMLAFFDDGSSGGSVLKVRVGNAGYSPSPDDVLVNFYEGEPGNGGVLIGSVNLNLIEADSYTDVVLESEYRVSGKNDIYAVVDGENRVIECNELNNSVSIPAPELLPDLVPGSVDVTDVYTDPVTLKLSGSVQVSIVNRGNKSSDGVYEVLAYFDADSDRRFVEGSDVVLGRVTSEKHLSPDETHDIVLEVHGDSAYRDAPISIWLDSGNSLIELSETNNYYMSSSVCRVAPPPAGALELDLKWQWSGSSADPMAQDTHGPMAVGQLSDDNGDGLIDQNDTPDIVFASAREHTSPSSVLNVVSGVDGSEIWSIGGLDISHRASVALGDIDGDGVVEIVAVNKSRTKLYAYEHDGRLKWETPSQPSYAVSAYGVSDGISIADIDYDGHPEIILGRSVYSDDGSLRWNGTGDFGGNGIWLRWGYASIVADVDLSGGMEVVAGRTLYATDGRIIWHRGDISHDGWNAVGNFDDDEFAEIVLVSAGKVYLLEHTGQTIWGPVAIPGGGTGGPPTVADFDGDGKPEVGVAGASQYIVLETDGTLRWGSKTQDYSSSATGSSVFDFEGDGKAEVLYADERYFRIYSGVDGTVLAAIPNSSVTTIEYPNVVDVDNDGHAEIILGSNAYDSGNTRGVRVFEAVSGGWAPTRNTWNQHSYHITNINDDGTIPVDEQPSWLTHNTYRLNTFLDRDPLASPDLSAARLKLLDNGADQPFSASLRVGNGGDNISPNNVTVSLYEGDPRTDGRLLGLSSIDSLPVNDYRDVRIDGIVSYQGGDLYAMVDSGNEVNECNEDNNIVSILGATQKSVLGNISVTTDSAHYAPESPALLQAIVNNAGALNGEFVASLRVEDVSGVVIQSFAEQPITGLAAGASLTFTEVWNTAAYLSGSYRLHGFLYGLDGSLLSESTSLFDIRHSADDGPDAGLRLTTDKAQYHSSDAVNITGLVNNLTERHILQGSRLQLRLTHVDDTQEELGEWPVRELMPQTSHEQHVAHVLDKAQEGIYGVSGTLLDSSGNILATDSTSFSVKEDLSIALSGRVVTQVPSLYRGEVQRCTDTISNAGSMNLAAQPIRYVVADLNNGVEFQYSDSVIELPSGGEYSSEREVDTSDYSIGMHACLLQTQINGNWTTLAYQSFDVMAPPIEIDSMLMRGEHGRLLVLLDTAKGSCNGLSSVTLSTELDLLPEAAASLQAELLDANGSVLDVEQALMSVDMPVNLSLAANDADLSISAFTHESLQVAVNLGGPVLHTGYRVRLSLIDGEGSYSFDSGLFTPDCELSELDVLGDLRVADVGILTASNDPLSKPELATLEEQRELLETWLDEAGWSYTIVTDAMDFTRELRSGAYTTYLLHGEHERLSIPVQKELREAVYRGEGLVVAGSHDERHHNIDEALGIKVAGKLNHVDGLYLVGDLADLGQLHFASPRQLLRYEPEQHETLAQTLSRGWPAIGLNRYGEGRSMTIGFDLLAEGAQDGAELDVLGSILLEALDTVHPRTVIYPDAIHAKVGSVYPLRIMLRNIGIPTEGQVVLMLPEGGEVVDVHEGYEENGVVIWPFELAEEQLLFLDLWLRLPESPGGLSLEAQIYTGAPGSLEYYGTSTLEFELDTLTELQDVQTNLDELRVNHNGDVTLKHVGRDLDKANSYNASGDIESALLQMVRAADELIEDARREFDTLRRRLADALRTVAADLTD